MAGHTGARKWTIEGVQVADHPEEVYKVVFLHDGKTYELGLFSSREEGVRVADVLTSK